VNEPIVGIDSDSGYPICPKLRQIFVKQFDRAYTDGNEDKPLASLKTAMILRPLPSGSRRE
jgi:hypothetical protein